MLLGRLVVDDMNAYSRGRLGDLLSKVKKENLKKMNCLENTFFLAIQSNQFVSYASDKTQTVS